MSDLYGGMVLTSEEANLSLSMLEGFAKSRDGKALGEIYEHHVPRISFDVEKAIIDMRSASTGGAVTDKL